MADEATPPDLALTAVTHDGAFRVIVARTTETVRRAVESQGVHGDDATHLADVVSGTILVRLTMAPKYRVQGIVRGADQRGTLVGDSHPDGTARGLVQRPAGLDRVKVGRGAIMQMMRTFPTGAVQSGVVEVEDDGVSGALMSYFQASEQITSVARVGSLFSGDALEAAGGFLVQLLPEVSRAPLAVMTERLDADFSDIPTVVRALQEDPASLLQEILWDMPFEQTQEEALRFGCRCSSVRVLSSLATLPKADIKDLMESEEHLHITCEYCGQTYELPPKALAGLLSSS
ncbi:MAG TPA: Hsp33 family molecular chaperone HslO [Sandaracinaceae bacterium LLY-WYZ-13_1]|nr:Hsp33 family molecular chaperone HslO [Sandaracinaceae bacterium LLY-WYZ-13_1]